MSMSRRNALKRPHSPPLNDAGLEDEEGESSSPKETTQPMKYIFEVTSESVPVDDEVKKIEEDTEKKIKRWIESVKTIKNSAKNVDRMEQILGYPSSEVKKFELEHAKTQNSMITEILEETEKDWEMIENAEKCIRTQHEVAKLAEANSQNIAKKKKL